VTRAYDWTRVRREVIAVAFLGSAWVVTASCERLERGKQVRAQGELQYLVGTIEQLRAKSQALPRPAELQTVVDRSRLIDPWGNSIRYELITEGGGEHYVLVCSGADGKLDEVNFLNYLHAIPQDVSYHMNSDIVVVDGKFVRNAGK
jgi:hypothetical protein